MVESLSNSTSPHFWSSQVGWSSQLLGRVRVESGRVVALLPNAQKIRMRERRKRQRKIEETETERGVTKEREIEIVTQLEQEEQKEQKRRRQMKHILEENKDI